MTLEEAYEILEHSGHQSPTVWSQAAQLAAREMAHMLKEMKARQNLLPLPHNDHPEGWTCTACEDVRDHNAKVMSGAHH